MTLKCTRDLQKNLARKVKKIKMDLRQSVPVIHTICHLYFVNVAIGSLDVREFVEAS